MIVVSGGSASGKSALGEQICCHQGGKLLYIATMRPFGAEAAPRIARHQAIRAGKGFHTLECYRDLEDLELETYYDVALLEDMGNLVANQMFETNWPEEDVVASVLRGVKAMRQQVGLLVVIANDVFASGEQYTPEMDTYLRCLGRVQTTLAQQSVTVIEAVCGLPLVHKGTYPLQSIQQEERCSCTIPTAGI